MDVKRGAYEKNNQPKKASFKYQQEGRLCLRVAKIESKYGTITGKRCPLFDYTEKKIVTIYAYKKEIMNEFARIRKLTLSQSPWVKKFKLTRYGSVNLQVNSREYEIRDKLKLMRSTFIPSPISKGTFEVMGCPSCQFVAQVKFTNMHWQLYPGNQRHPPKTT